MSIEARKIIIRSLGLIKAYGYVGKNEALIHNKIATSTVLKNSFDKIPKITPLEESTHGATADEILKWLNLQKTNEYLVKCANIIPKAAANPVSAYGLLAYTPVAFEAYNTSLKIKQTVSAPAQLVGRLHDSISIKVKVLNIEHFLPYDKLTMLDVSTGALLTHLKQPKQLQTLKIDDIITISAKIAKHMIGNPSETRLSRVKLIKEK